MTGTDGAVRVWNISRAAPGEVLTLPGPESAQADVRFTPDGRRLVANSGPEGTVLVWSVETGERLLVLDAHARQEAGSRAVPSLDVSPDGAQIATAGRDGIVRIFDATTGESLQVLRGHRCSGPPENDCGVTGVAFSPDGSQVATTGVDKTVRIFAAKSGRPIRVIEQDASLGLQAAHPLAWSPDGRRLLAIRREGTRVWDARSGELVFTLPPSGGPGHAAAWSPDGTRLVVEGRTGPTVWDAETGEQLGELTTGQGELSLAFTRDGRRLAISAFDTTIRIWDWAAATELLKLPLAEQGRIAFSPDGDLLAHVAWGGTAGSNVRIFALDVDRLLQVARERVTRSLSVEECRRYLQRACTPQVDDAAAERPQVEGAPR